MGFIPLISLLSMDEKSRNELWRAKAAISFMENFLSSPQRPRNADGLFDSLGMARLGKGQFCERPASEEGDHAFILALVAKPDSAGFTQFGIARFDDKAEAEKESWNNFLDLANLYQVLPWFFWTAASSTVDAEWLARLKPASPEVKDGWDEVYELAVKSWLPLIRHLHEIGAPLPEIGYEMSSESGAVAATAEVAWPDRKVAIIDASIDIAAAALPQGWRLLRWEPGEEFPVLDFGGSL